jgi:hypothetical protein
VGGDEVRLEPARLAVLGNGLIQLSFLLKSQAEIVVIRGEIGLESNGLAEFSGRSAIIPFDIAQNVAKRIVGVGEVGPDADGDAVLGDRLVYLLLQTQGLAEVVVEGGVVGLDADGFAVLGDGPSGFPCMNKAKPRLKCA